MTPPLRLPNNALYHTESDPGSHYLIETDPAYANFKTWISSDTMIRALNQSPDTVIKRIGDGFYEQQLVAQQVLSLTGQRFIGDYTSNEAEYKALLNGGVQAAQAFNLTIGTALTDAQMAALTTDIVWLVKETVTLADGSTQEVLTPQVYLHARDIDLTGNGALISGKNVSIQNSGDVNSPRRRLRRTMQTHRPISSARPYLLIAPRGHAPALAAFRDWLLAECGVVA
jgi:filamentous hemagglutinin